MELQELMRVTDPVLISFVESLLRDADIEPLILDRNMSVLEGSLGVLPCRILVTEDDWSTAARLIREADLGHWIIEEKPR